VGEGVVLGHRQGVDVGTQADGAAGGAVLHDADDAGLAQAAVAGDAPFGERLGDDVGGAFLVEAQLGVGVDVAPDRGRDGGVGEDGLDDLHGRLRGGLVQGILAAAARRRPACGTFVA